MEIRELRSLVTLKEVGKLTGIAERRHLSAAAIHKQLKVLEDELGVRLYEKSGRQLRLTQAAEIILPHVRNLLAQYDAALSALQEWKGFKRGCVRIGTGPTMSSYVLPPLLEEFRRRHRDLELYVETGHSRQLIEDLENGSLDLLIVVSSELIDVPNLLTERTWDFEIAFVSGVASWPRRCPMADLKRYPFILYKPGSLFENIVGNYLAESGFHPRVVMRFDNPEAVKAMIGLGLGVSILPMWVIDSEIRKKSLFLIRQEERPLIAKFALVTRQDSYVPQPVHAFIDVARNWNWKKVRLMSPERGSKG